MKVFELIDILRGLDQEASVVVYNGYDPEYGNCYKEADGVKQESVGWDSDKNEPVNEVYVE